MAPAAKFSIILVFLYYTLRLFQKKIPGGGGGGGGGGGMADDIFFYGWLVRKVFKLYGSLVFDHI